MSVIYRSLQQLKEKEQERAATATHPQAVAPQMGKLLGRFALYVLVVVVLVGSGVYFISQKVAEVDIPEAPTRLKTTGTQAVEVAEVTPEAPPEPVQLAPQVITEPIVKQRLIRQVGPRDTGPKIDLTKPTKALEDHFAKQARKNESVISLERKLIQASKSGDLSESRDILTSMTSKLGSQESSTKYKWDGYLALKEKRYADAENFYRRALSVKPGDMISQVNLVYSLMGQGKNQEAVLIYRKLIDRYPMDTRVLKLGDMLGER